MRYPSYLGRSTILITILETCELEAHHASKFITSRAFGSSLHLGSFRFSTGLCESSCQRSSAGFVQCASLYFRTAVSRRCNHTSCPIEADISRETAAEENSTAYFPLLDRVADGHFSDCSTDKELYDTFLKVLEEDGHITNADALSSFQFALSIHSAAPRIEAHYQYYDTSVEPSLMIAQDAACPVWVHFDGKQYCSPALDRAQQDVAALK